MIFIATFYSHFGAIRFKRLCEQKGMTAKIMPVPRDLSSSCGSCVRFEGTTFLHVEEVPDEVEQVVEVTVEGYVVRYVAENG